MNDIVVSLIGLIGVVIGALMKQYFSKSDWQHQPKYEKFSTLQELLEDWKEFMTEIDIKIFRVQKIIFPAPLNKRIGEIRLFTRSNKELDMSLFDMSLLTIQFSKYWAAMSDEEVREHKTKIVGLVCKIQQQMAEDLKS